MATTKRPHGALPRGRRGPLDVSCRSAQDDAEKPIAVDRRARSEAEGEPMIGLLALLAAQAAAAPPAKTWPTHEQDIILKDFRFGDGEALPSLRMHVTTLGSPHRNAANEIDNAVMVLHGTGGDGHQFLRPQFADELYGPGQPLDIRKYWIILPDNIGHGKSSKPSDGLRMKFPKYDYYDMIEAQHRMLTEGLGITHMRLIMGTSMGCMHSFLWGEMYPDFMSALMPLACEPIEIAGL